MNLLNVENIKKTYSEKTLLNDISFSISDTDRIGLIGLNGAGKSTLLKIVAGKDEFFEGNITKGKSVRIEYLPQNPAYDTSSTVLEQVFGCDNKELNLLMQYERTLDEIAKCKDQSINANENLIKLQQKIDDLNLWSLESEVKTILTQLGISNFHEKMGN